MCRRLLLSGPADLIGVFCSWHEVVLRSAVKAAEVRPRMLHFREQFRLSCFFLPMCPSVY